MKTLPIWKSGLAPGAFCECNKSNRSSGCGCCVLGNVGRTGLAVTTCRMPLALPIWLGTLPDGFAGGLELKLNWSGGNGLRNGDCKLPEPKLPLTFPIWFSKLAAIDGLLGPAMWLLGVVVTRKGGLTGLGVMNWSLVVLPI